MLVSSLVFFRCPVCETGKLVADERDILDGHIFNGTLYCKECPEEYEVWMGVPNLLPKKIREALETEKAKRRFKLTKSLKKILPGRKHQEVELKLTEDEENLVKQIIASDNMAPGYRHFVVDSMEYAPSSAYFYERFEDLFLLSLLEKQMKDLERDLLFAEVGSGPGRYLVQLGAKATKRVDACQRYRAHPEIGSFYQFDRAYEERLKMIIGIDFSQKMIEMALKWLSDTKLDALLFSDRILQVIAGAQYLTLNFEDTVCWDTYKIVTCMFQTMGNQLSPELQIQLLKKMKEFAQPKGTIVLSVFNKRVFDEYVDPYYKMIKKSIGELKKVDRTEKSITTDLEVYSRWMDEEEVSRLFREAGYNLKKVQIRAGIKDPEKGGMPEYPKNHTYVPKTAQKAARERGIIATAEI